MSLSYLLTTLLLTVPSDGWPDYRGPSGNGHAVSSNLPVKWSETENITWKTEIHGRGWSTPVFLNDVLWMTTATDRGHEMSVIGVDAETGDVLFDEVLIEVEEPEFRNALNSYASPSPVTDGKNVYVHFGTYGTACLDGDSAEVLWQRTDINCKHLMGPGSSPILFENLLIFHVDGADVQFVIALDKTNGETVWHTARSTDFTNYIPDQQKAYSTPLITMVNGKPQLLSTGAQGAMGYDPRTGKEIWHLRYVGYSMSARPVVGHGMAYLNTGFDKAKLIAMKLGGEGDITETHIEWVQNKNVPTMSSPVLVNDWIFQISDGGIANCVDAKTGDTLWRERLGAQYCSSPLYNNGRVYFFDREGKAFVVAAKPKFELLAENELESGFMACPTVVGDTLFLRSKKHLYRIENE